MDFKEFAKKKEIIWITPKQAAQLMQCSVEHIYDLAKSGKIPYIRDGKNKRFLPKDLDEYTNKSYVRSSHATV